MLTPGALPYMGGTPMPFATGMAPGTPVPDVARAAEPEMREEEPAAVRGAWQFFTGRQPSVSGQQLGAFA